jgi:hypothetical protein
MSRRATDAGGAVTRAFSWTLICVTFLLAPLGVVLALLGQHRGLDLPDGRGTQLFVELAMAVAGLLYAVVGLLIARAQPSNSIGWIFLASAPALALSSAANGYADLAFYGGEAWRSAVAAAWLASWLLIVPVFVSPCLIAQLFPSGAPMEGRWRGVARISVVFGAYLALGPALAPGPLGSYPDVSNPAGLPGVAGELIVDPTWGVAIIGLFVLSLVSIVVRFRASRGVERLQLRWLALAGGTAIGAFLVALTVGDAVGGAWGAATGDLGLACMALIPIAVGVAILRYRLYEIDRIVSRTLAYAVLTVILGAIYAALVLAGQAVFSSVAGGSNLAIAVSTLVVAAVFLPLRSSVQAVVDRRFYRRRYDAQRTLEGFGSRLRDQVDLEILAVDLERTVAETMEPAHVSVWLRSAP